MKKGRRIIHVAPQLFQAFLQGNLGVVASSNIPADARVIEVRMNHFDGMLEVLAESGEWDAQETLQPFEVVMHRNSTLDQRTVRKGA